MLGRNLGLFAALCCRPALRSAGAQAPSAALQPPSAAAAAAAAAPRAPFLGLRFATSKGGGSTRNGRDSQPKFLGVKCFGGHWVEPGNIIVRQRGARFGVVASTATVGMGKDHTIFALVPGYVKFWHNAQRGKNYVEVVRSAPGEPGPPLQYPVSRVRGDWDLAQLDRLVARAEASGSSVAPPLLAAPVTAALEAWRAARVVRLPAVAGGGGAAAVAAAAAARSAGSSSSSSSSSRSGSSSSAPA